MSANRLTRGPLPPSVYWRRRAVVALVALTLVFGIGRVLGLGSDASDGTGTSGGTSGGAAELAGARAGEPATSGDAEPTDAASGGAGGRGEEGGTNGKNGKGGKKDKAPELAAPVGTCQDDDISVTPQVGTAEAGRDITFTLALRTLETPACTWEVSAKHLTLKVTSGSDAIWSTLDCPRAITAQSVVVRQAEASTIQVVWGGRRSDETCSRFTDYAMPGFYHLAAAALGGEPSDVQFELVRPAAAVITRTADPTPSPKADGDRKKDRR